MSKPAVPYNPSYIVDVLATLKPWQRILHKILFDERLFRAGKPNTIILHWDGTRLIPLETAQMCEGIPLK